jgi:hypothetical protein
MNKGVHTMKNLIAEIRKYHTYPKDKFLYTEAECEIMLRDYIAVQIGENERLLNASLPFCEWVRYFDEFTGSKKYGSMCGERRDYKPSSLNCPKCNRPILFKEI